MSKGAQLFLLGLKNQTISVRHFFILQSVSTSSSHYDGLVFQCVSVICLWNNPSSGLQYHLNNILPTFENDSASKSSDYIMFSSVSAVKFRSCVIGTRFVKQ